jgi:hypothetical protein
MDKQYRLTPDQMKPLIESTQGCLATDRITVDGELVGYMQREEPLSENDSGWRFFAGDESDLYLQLPQNHGFHTLNAICNYDPAIIPFLEYETPCAFLRAEEGDEFDEVMYDPNGDDE